MIKFHIRLHSVQPEIFRGHDFWVESSLANSNTWISHLENLFVAKLIIWKSKSNNVVSRSRKIVSVLQNLVCFPGTISFSPEKKCSVYFFLSNFNMETHILLNKRQWFHLFLSWDCLASFQSVAHCLFWLQHRHNNDVQLMTALNSAWKILKDQMFLKCFSLGYVMVWGFFPILK